VSLVAFSFLHPGLLGGLALVGLPILIHILNRRRFKTMDWAAMDFLLKAAVRNRRRVRFENLLLLALRVGLVALLVLLVARPFTRRKDALASLFGSEGAVERVILLDDSHSMNAGQGNRTAFTHAKQLIQHLVTRLHDERSSDRVTLVLASRPRRGGEGFVRVAVASAQYARMLRALNRLRPTDRVFDVAASLDAVLESFQDKQAPLVLHLVSDFRRPDWTEPDGSLQPEVLAALRRFTRRGEVRLLDVGAPPVPNAGVTALEPSDRAVIAGVPATFVATVKNFGPEPAANLSVEFHFGDRVELPERIETTLQPGQEVQVKKEFTFGKEGPAVVEAKLPADALPGDDLRRRVVRVRKTMRFLLVDGETDPEPYRSETDFLAAALMPPGRTASGIAADVVSEHAFSARDLDSYDGVFLCNVYRLPPERLQRLEAFVAAGGGLVFFLGDQVDPQVYNSSLYGGRENQGKGLLPLRLIEAEGSADGFVNLAAPGADHPVIRFLRGLNRIVFRTVAVRRYMRVEPSDKGGARVILTYTDDDTSPALAEKGYGRGRVLMFTTAADLEWSDFPRSVLYLPLVQESARYVAKPDSGAYTLPVGAPLQVRFDPKRIGPRLSVVPPPELGGTPVTIQSGKDEKTHQLFFRYDRTDRAGVYIVRMATPEGEPFEQPYAYNVAPAEGDLRRASPARIVEKVPGLRLDRAGQGSLLDTDRSDRTEFWRTLLYLLIAVAGAETLLAWRFGHHKSRRLEAEGKQVFVR